MFQDDTVQPRNNDYWTSILSVVEDVFSAASSTVVKKCCDQGEVLNMWHVCQDVGDDTLLPDLAEYMRNISDDASLRVKNNNLHCHRKMMHEFLPLSIFENRSILVEGGDGDQFLDDYHCIDFVASSLGFIEPDPSAILCDLPGNQIKYYKIDSFVTISLEKVGNLKKCCPLDQILDDNLAVCVPDPFGGLSTADDFIPSRMVLTPDSNYKPTGGYHLRINTDLADICHQRGVIPLVPEQFTTDGGVFVFNDGDFSLVDYDCADRVLRDGDVTDVVALSCKTEETFKIVSKCCGDEEYFYFKEDDTGVCHENDFWMTTSVNISASGLLIEAIYDTITSDKTFVEHDFIHSYKSQPNCSSLHKLDSSLSNMILRSELMFDLSDRLCIDLGEDDGDDDDDDDDGLKPVVFVCEETLPLLTSLNQEQDVLRMGFDDFNQPHILDLVDSTASCTSKALVAFYSFLGSVSLISLILAFITLMTIAEYKSLNGKIILTNVAVTILVNIYLIAVYNGGGNTGHSDCVILGYYGYFTNLSMFSWMSVWCVDLSWTFYKVQLQTGSQNKRYLSYCLIGFGFPFLLTLLASILQVLSTY